MKNEQVIKIENLFKSFEVADGLVAVLKDLTFEINEGDFAVIYGPSGCGKSTLLHTILGLEKPTKGIVEVLGKSLYQNFSEDQLADFRKRNIGMVYQQPNWVKALNLVQNVALPLILLNQDYESSLQKALEMLSKVGLTDWSSYHPSELSSGQQQKASLVRAMITNPKIIIADEPTGNLDFESGEELIGLIKQFTKDGSKTVIMVTHDLEYLRHANKAIKLFDGRVEKIFSPQDDKDEMAHTHLKRKIYKEAL